MQNSIDFIRDNLKEIYPQQEIEQFIRLIFEHFCQYTRVDMILNKNRQLPENLREEIRRFTQRLKRHEPIQYILGYSEFLDMKFLVRPGVLIPRPETEELIELISRENTHPGLFALDIGTGSGCIAISLASKLRDAHVTAWDISDSALEVAQENARLLHADVSFEKRDVLQVLPDQVDRKFDLIVSNPPYVCEFEKKDMEPNVLDYEPHLALFVSDDDPLIFYRRIAQLGRCILNPGGRIYFEINALFGEETLSMLKTLGYDDPTLIRDIHGKQRRASATYNHSSPQSV